jgi:hypothetical protein
LASQTALLLVVYVDDFKLAGPAESMSVGWQLIQSGLKIGAPEDAGLYLGCRHVVTTVPGPTAGSSVKRLEYNMEDFLVGRVARYRELSGPTELKHVPTPFLDESREPIKIGEKTKIGRSFPSLHLRRGATNQLLRKS